MRKSMRNTHLMFKFSASLSFVFISFSAFAQQTWSEVPAPDPSQTRNMLRDIGGTLSADVWTIGSYETNAPAIMKNLVMHWNGSSWTTYTGTDLSTTWNDLWGVTAITANNVWAVGSYNAFANTRAQLMHWNGSSWTHTMLPENPGGSYLDGIDAISANDIWAVGGQSGSPTSPCYAIHYNGSNWTEVTVPNVGIFRNTFNDVDGVAANEVWAVGHFGEHYGDFHAMAQHWNGSNWTNSALPESVSSPLGELYHVTMISSNDVWALGSTITGDLLMIHYDGTSWSLVPTAGSSGGAIAARSATEVFSVGYRISQWDGSSWTIIDSLNDVIYPTLVSTVTFSNGDIWTAGTSGADGFYTLVYRSDPVPPLAVQMSAYSVTKSGNSAMMEWSTVAEIYADKFVMERSQDLINFMEISQIPAAGSAHDYKLIDVSPLQGHNYYRLKQYDVDGHVTVFPIKHLNFDMKDKASFSFYPNPVQDNMIHLQLPGSDNRQLYLYDAKGQRVGTWTIGENEDQTDICLPDGLSPGTYMMTLVTGDKVMVEKVVVQ